MANGLDQKVQPSSELGEIVGHRALKRSAVTKKIWVYIKAGGLQDESDGRIIIPDEALAAVTGKRPFNMMKLMGKLSKHLEKV